MKIIELIKLIMANKELIIQIIEFIKTFFPAEGDPVVFSASAADEQFPELAAACAAQGLTLEEVADVVQQVKDEQKEEG